jgi:hypothetical protein
MFGILQQKGNRLGDRLGRERSISTVKAQERPYKASAATGARNTR